MRLKQPIVVLNGTNDFPRRNLLRYALCVMLFSPVLLGRPAGAQAGQQFVGIVTDPSHAVVADAVITVHNEATGEDVVAKTTKAGDYTVPYLKTGMYTVTADKPGFKALSFTHIALNTDKTAKIDFLLPVGSVNETVTVNSAGAQIELAKADRGEIIDAERIQEMPSDGRNILELFDLSPGTINNHGLGSTSTRPEDNVAGDLYANGNAVTSSPVQQNLDGATNDVPGGFIGYVPPPDSVAEFKVVLNPYDASYGRAGGAAIDVTLKSGTNHLHGDMYWYGRRPWLDAQLNSYDYNYSLYEASTNQCPPYPAPQPTGCLSPGFPVNHKRDQFGLQADGPISIPHLYNGKDKTFFLFQWEQVYEDVPDNSTSVNSIPNPAWLKGDFSTAQFEFTPQSGKNKQNLCPGQTQCLQPLIIYDPNSPVTTVVDPNDGLTKRAHSPFPGNIIPQSRLDPLGQMISQYYNQLTPNYNPGPGYAPFVNNFFFQPVEHDLIRNFLAKIDQNFGPRDRATVRWEYFERWSNDLQNGIPASNGGNYILENVQPKDNSFALEEVHTFTANLILDNKVTLLNERQNRIYGTKQPGILADLGFSQDFIQNAFYTNLFPYIHVTSGSGAPGAIDLGPNTGNPPSNNQIAHNLAYQPSITFIHGKHSIRAGLDMRLLQFANPGSGAQDQSLTYTNNFTQHYTPANPDAAGFTSGSGVAALVLGDPNAATVKYTVDPFYSQHYYGIWAQDDWRATSRLTLNFGIRYDLLSPRTERHNKMNYAFDTSDISPIDGQLTTRAGLSGPLMGGIRLAGVDGNPRGAYAMNLLNIQPRFGAAYAFTPRTSLRAGFGEEFINDEGTDSSNGLSSSATNYQNFVNDGPNSPCGATVVTDNTCPFGHASDPFALGYSKPTFTTGPNGTLYTPTEMTPTLQQELLTTPGGSVNFKDPHYQIPSLWGYSVEVQQLLSRRDVFTLAYSGSRAYNLLDSLQINNVSAAWNARCDVERLPYPGIRQNCDSTTTSAAALNCPVTAAGFAAPPPGDCSSSQALSPFYQVPAFAGTGYYTNQYISTGALTRPYPQFTGVSQDNSPFVHSWYNSMQVTASHNVAKSLSLHSALTWSKAMKAGQVIDSINGVYGRALSGSDTPIVLTFSGVFYAPVGRGRTFLRTTNRLVDAVVGGWEISPLYVYTQGKPISLGSNWEYNGPIGVKVHDLPTDANHNYKRLAVLTPCVAYKDTNTGALTYGPSYTAANCTYPLAVQAPNGYAIGRNTVYWGARTGSIHQFDTSVSKHFAWNEKLNLQLRLDAFNVLNHPNWGNGPNTTASSIDFGTVAKNGTPSVPSRQMQISAKLIW